MFHVRTNSLFVAFTVVFLAVMRSCRGQQLVIGPSEPVVALVGEDVILPCHLNPAMNVFEMTLEWARPDLNPRFVFVWRDGVELKSKKHPLYEGRTSVFTEELKNGNISMKLSEVRLSDEGEYKCFVPDVGESKVQLVVGAVSSPVVDVTKNSSTAVLQCEAKGWYPEPEVFWLDGEGNLLSAGPPETVRGPDDLYTVSRRLTVRKSDNFTCRVQQKDINQTRETHFYVPDGFFVVPSTSSQHVVVGSVIGCAALMVLAAVFVWWKWKQRKSKNKTTSPEDGAEQTEKHETITSKSENTEFQIEMEEEGESVPLMAAREENNEDNRGEQVKSQSEHKDAEFVMERETQQDQLRTKPEAVTCNQDMDVTGGEKTATSMNNEEATLIPTQETQRHKHQDNLLGRQGHKTEGEKTIKPVKEASGLPVVLVHTDQEVQKEEETQQEQPTEERQTENDVDKKEAKTKKEKEQERAEQKGSGRKMQPENRREQMKQKAERQKMENKRKRELELERRRERVKDETEVEPQQRDGDRHLLEDKTQEESKTEHEDDKGNDQEGNQSEFMRTTERTAENQEEQRNENVKEKQTDEKLERSEEKKDDREHGQQLPSVSREVPERPNLKIHQETAERKNKEVQEENEKGNGNQQNSSGDQQLLRDKTKQSEAEHEDKKGNDLKGNQSDFMRTTGRTAEKQKKQRNKNVKEKHQTTRMTGRKLMNQKEQIEKLERSEEKRDDRGEHGQQLPSVSREGPERPNLKIHPETAERKNKEVQEEKRQEETREQPERSTETVNVEFKERRSDKGADDDETQETSKETEKQEELQPAKEETREQPQNLQSVNEQNHQREPTKQLHVDQQQAARRKEHQEETRQQPQNVQSVTERGVKLQEVQQGEMDVNPTPDIENYQRKIMRKKRERTKQDHLSQQQSARRKRHQRKNRVQTQRKIKEYLKELSDLQMEAKQCQRWRFFSPPSCQEDQQEHLEEPSDQMEDIQCYTEKQVIHEPQRWDLNSQPVCQEDQQEEEPMDL